MDVVGSCPSIATVVSSAAGTKYPNGRSRMKFEIGSCNSTQLCLAELVAFLMLIDSYLVSDFAKFKLCHRVAMIFLI